MPAVTHPHHSSSLLLHKVHEIVPKTGIGTTKMPNSSGKEIEQVAS
jgi:hypothetical protein